MEQKYHDWIEKHESHETHGYCHHFAELMAGEFP